jgi:hypothetical protein
LLIQKNGQPPSSLDNICALQAGRANLDLTRVGAILDTDVAQIRQKTALGNAGRVQTDAALILGKAMTHNPIARHRPLATHITNSGHKLFSLEKGDKDNIAQRIEQG